ncbi:hypothetical protein GH714_022497 [Hevea brasiliensis]|uniref:FLZ-type domain-containing protein n=1 Tax=Hevea brasiliensis TaxID=3981 RepID=A0A6A6LIQ3_HEVBR|nr:hypothetical protein GH714_022497 [Hevea brasiliensis]
MIEGACTFNLMADSATESHCQSDASGLRHISSTFFNFPGFFVGFGSRGSSDSDSIRSPTSLDFSFFSNLSNSFSQKSRSPTQNGHQKKWDCSKVGKSDSDAVFGNDGVRLEPKPFEISSPISLSPTSPLSSKKFCSDSRTTTITSLPQFSGGCTQTDNSSEIKSSSLPVPIGSSHGCVGSLSAREIELSEDYTCIISYGPNPKTTHIFGDCILECHTNEMSNFDKTQNLGSELPQEANCLELEGPTSHPSNEFLSFCYSCKKKLEKGDDIYINRGEKAFCSFDCHSEEIFAEDETEKTCDDSPKSSPASSYHEDIFLTKESELKTPEDNSKEQLALQRYTPPNPFLSLLNVLGVFGTGVIGALYALTKKEKKATETAIESMTAKLKEKEAAILSLEKNFESKLLNKQEEWTKQLRRAKDEQLVLVNQLKSANSTITGLGQELKNEKRTVDELKFQMDILETNLSKSSKMRKIMFNISPLHLLKRNGIEELESYSDLKLSSEKKAALDTKLLAEREDELHQLKEKLELALNEVSRNQAMITDLTQVKVDLRKMLDAELNNVMNLKHELQGTQEDLGKLRNEASDLAKELLQSRNRCTDLEAEVSRVQAEFSEAAETMRKRLEKETQSGEVLANEIIAVREQLMKTKDEMQLMSHELAAVTENRDSVQKELIDVYQKAESQP